MEKQTKSPYRTKYHRDGTVTVWDVYQQEWRRIRAADLIAGNSILPRLPASERQRIEKMASVN